MTRQQIIDELRQIAGYSRSKSAVCREAADLLEQDVVEVVRCKDCGHKHDVVGETYKYCEKHNTAVYADDFCSYGK